MIQGYFLSILYLAASAMLMTLDYQRKRVMLILKFRALLEEDSRWLNGFFFLGQALFLILLFFPCSPGPVILGDIIPASAILLSSIYFRILYSERYKDNVRLYDTWLSRVRKGFGITLFIIAILHFVLPSFVLI